AMCHISFRAIDAAPIQSGVRHGRARRTTYETDTARAGYTRPLPCNNNTAYFAAINATVVSSMRLEKPHSLSYQEDTLTSEPDTLVRAASTVLDAGSWL